MLWFAGSVVSDLNSVLKPKNSTKSLLAYLISLKRSNGTGLATLVTSREWIQKFGQEKQMIMWYLGFSPRGHSQLCWSDVITKDLKDLNIKKELTHEQVEWQRTIMPRKIQL